ncbi:hypothetical protein ACFQVA_29570 [Actinomadura keratinilytica]
MLRRAARDRVATVERLTAAERRASGLAREARAALDEEQVLAARQHAQHRAAREKLDEVTALVSSSPRTSSPRWTAWRRNAARRPGGTWSRRAASARPPRCRPGAASGRCGSRSTRSASRTCGAPRARTPTTARG